jgi:hypothetical protein
MTTTTRKTKRADLRLVRAMFDLYHETLIPLNEDEDRRYTAFVRSSSCSAAKPHRSFFWTTPSRGRLPKEIAMQLSKNHLVVLGDMCLFGPGDRYQKYPVALTSKGVDWVRAVSTEEG